jgi:hypothetical protein
MVGGERTTCAGTASSLNLRIADARRPLTHRGTDVVSLPLQLCLSGSLLRQVFTDEHSKQPVGCAS